MSSSSARCCTRGARAPGARGAGDVASAESRHRGDACRGEQALEILVGEDKADAEEIVSRLDGIIIQISANASEAGKLFGSVGVVEIAQALQDQVGLEIDRKDISGETVKEIGTHQFTLNLHPEVEMQITVDVQGDV